MLISRSTRESFARQCRTRARNFNASVHVKRSNEKRERRVPPCLSVLVALESPRRSNNRPADIHGREVDRDGEPGLYPRGKSPERNQHDRGERPTRACMYNATGIISDYLRRSAISISVRRRLFSYIARCTTLS